MSKMKLLTVGEIMDLPIEHALPLARKMLEKHRQILGQRKTAIIDGIDDVLMNRCERWKHFSDSKIDDVTLSGGDNGTVTIISGVFCENLTAYLKSKKARII
jgi:hypothetical protein